MLYWLSYTGLMGSEIPKNHTKHVWNFVKNGYKLPNSLNWFSRRISGCHELVYVPNVFSPTVLKNHQDTDGVPVASIHLRMVGCANLIESLGYGSDMDMKSLGSLNERDLVGFWVV